MVYTPGRHGITNTCIIARDINGKYSNQKKLIEGSAILEPEMLIATYILMAHHGRASTNC